MAAYYDKQIIDLVAASDRPLRHRDIAEMIAPGGHAAWNSIGNSLTNLYRVGLLSREKTDGRYWHYRTGDGAAPLLDRLAALLTAARAYRDAWQGGQAIDAGPLAIGEHWDRLRAAIEALDERTS